MKKDFAKDLIKFIDKSTTMFHAVESSRELLEENGFTYLDSRDRWDLKKSGAYYTTRNNSALVAFIVGEDDLRETGFRLIGAHTDSPGFKIKPNPEIKPLDRYLKLNTEVYGGPIFSSWFDRPLSLAGRVVYKGDNPMEPREALVDLEKPIGIIPNLAIHMNREVNSGFEINPQNHIQPILSMVNKELEKDNYLLNLLGENLSIDPKDILDFDIYLYGVEKASLVGVNEEFISGGRLDDLAMVHAGLTSLINSKGRATRLVAAFDNEEVGSETKQGAGSPMVRNILKRISLNLGLEEEDYLRALEKSFIISADMAHAVHPNFIEKADPTNQPVINQGPVIKYAANQAYTSDGVTAAIYEGICRKAGVPIQKFTNRSDSRGGSTIGPISSSQLDIKSVDIGNPMLAMHSIRELAGVDDHYYVYKSFLEYFNL